MKLLVSEIRQLLVSHFHSFAMPNFGTDLSKSKKKQVQPTKSIPKQSAGGYIMDNYGLKASAVPSMLLMSAAFSLLAIVQGGLTTRRGSAHQTKLRPTGADG